MENPATDDAHCGRLRVCMLLQRLGIGGAESHVLHLLEHLDRSRFAVSLCCLKRGDKIWEEKADRAAESFIVLEFRLRKLPLTLIRLVRYLRWGRFDVLHCHLSLADVIGRVAGWIAGIPVIITTEHGKHIWKSWPHLLLERLLIRVTDLRICVSHDIIEIRRRREGTPNGKLLYIPNGVDLVTMRKVTHGKASVMSEFGWEPSDRLVISVGRLVPAKSYPTLVEVIDILRRRFPDVRCLIVGEGHCRGEIEAAIERFGVQDCFALTGARSDIPDLLSAADVFVLTSIREGLPISLLEAMAVEKGIVGTSVGGIPDAIADGENGLLVPPGNPEEIADAIGRLLDDAALGRALGRAAARVVEERFSIESLVHRIGDVYCEIYERKRHERE